MDAALVYLVALGMWVVVYSRLGVPGG